MTINADPIVIVLACDDRYVRHTAAAMVGGIKNYFRKNK